MVTNWIYEDNLEAFLEILAGFAGATFDPDDWNAIRFGIRETDVEKDRWCEWEFVGSHSLANARIARDPGSSVVFVQVQSDVDTEGKVKVAMNVAGSYWLSRAPGKGAQRTW